MKRLDAADSTSCSQHDDPAYGREVGHHAQRRQWHDVGKAVDQITG